jgi:iron complex outermembrane receptor protein
MFQKTKICSAVVLAFGSLLTLAAQAQDGAPTGETQRVEVTGSAIKRIAVEGALPIQTLTQDDIKKTGLTTVTDLIQSLPVMQGFTTSSQSINGGGGGVTNASLHDMGAGYTLVLLNGHRVASYGTGSAVDLNTIPLAAVDHVDVLLDGASALYGADAIAGVVNIILKKDSTDGLLSLSADMPFKAGGRSASASISKGFGNLSKDGYNLFLAASFDHQQAVQASQRSFSKGGGIVKFAGNEVDVLSTYSPVANVYAPTLTSTGTKGTTIYYNPSDCTTANTILKNGICYYNYAATVEDIPASRKSSFLANGRLDLNDKVSLFTNVLTTQSRVDARYAAPAQSFVMTASQIATYVDPYLTDGETANTASDIAKVRLIGVGGRKDGYLTNTLHTVIGADVSMGKWDSQFSFTHSQNHWYDIAEGGYSSSNAIQSLMESGAYDPFSTDPQADVLASAVLHQTLDQSRSTLDILSAHTSTSLATLPGGDLSLAAGVDLTRQKYVDRPSAIYMGTTDTVFGGTSGALPFDSARNSGGAFVELEAPLTKTLTVDGSARFDSYGAVHNKDGYDSDGNYTGPTVQGKKSSSTTFKLSSSFRPTKELLLRGSFGTGYKMPTIGNISAPLIVGGVTGSHSCPVNLPAELAAYCVSTPNEYNYESGGNPSSGAGALKPEKSTQWTLGFRIEPSPAFSFGTDLWTVRLRDQISSVSEDTAFADGATYASLFSILPDSNTGVDTLTFLSKPINTGTAFYQGLDFDAESHISTPIGKLTTRGHMTWMLHADYQSPGVSGYLNSMSKIGTDGTVTFRYQINATTSLEQGAFTHTVGFNFKPGYADDTTDWAAGRRVSSYAIFDFQERYEVNKALSLTGGIKNVFDRNPPTSLVDQSGTGNARGYDGRYTSSLGRTLQASLNYKF